MSSPRKPDSTDTKRYAFFKKPPTELQRMSLTVNEPIISQIKREMKAANLGMYPELVITVTKPDGTTLMPPNSPKTPTSKK